MMMTILTRGTKRPSRQRERGCSVARTQVSRESAWPHNAGNHAIRERILFLAFIPVPLFSKNLILRYLWIVPGNTDNRLGNARSLSGFGNEMQTFSPRFGSRLLLVALHANRLALSKDFCICCRAPQASIGMAVLPASTNRIAKYLSWEYPLRKPYAAELPQPFAP